MNGIDSDNREDELCETDTSANHMRADGFLQGRWYHTKTVDRCKSVMNMIFCRIDVFCSLYYAHLYFFIIGILAHCAVNYSFFCSFMNIATHALTIETNKEWHQLELACALPISGIVVCDDNVLSRSSLLLNPAPTLL